MRASTFSTVLLLGFGHSANAFLEELFGGNVQFQMGGGHQRSPPPDWPRGVSEEISKTMSWLKGTEWNWNNDGFTIKLKRDGDLEAPIQQCRRGSCRWTAQKGQVYLGLGDAGIFQLSTQEDKPSSLAGMRIQGRGVSNGQRLTLTYNKIFDYEAADLDKDLYEALGLTEDADDAEIKKVYRKLSIKYHPDKNPDEASKQKFAEIRDAYEILSDPDKKILYDTGGMEAVKDSEKGKIEQTSDFNSEIEVSLSDLYLGKEFKASIQRGIVCRGCRKNPGHPKCQGCRRCPNQFKVVQVQMGPFLTQQKQEVPSKELCKTEDATIDVHIERGMTAGDVLTFPRMAEERPGMLPGSVHLKLKQKEDQTYARKGNDLHMNLRVSLREALLGWSRTFTHMDGHSFEVKSKDVTKHSEVLKVRKQGMPLRDDPATFGDLYVKMAVEFPKKLDDRQKELVAQIFANDRQDL